jgi:hypothetical protein
MEQTTTHAFDDVRRSQIRDVRLHDFASVSHVLGPVTVTAAMGAR